MKGGIDLSITTLAIIIAVIAIVLLLVAAFQSGIFGVVGTVDKLVCDTNCGIDKKDCTPAMSGQSPPNWGKNEVEKKCVSAGNDCKCS